MEQSKHYLLDYDRRINRYFSDEHQELLAKCHDKLTNKEQLKNYYLLCYSNYINTNPLLACDYLIEGISNGSLTEKAKISKKLVKSIFSHSAGLTEAASEDCDNFFCPNYWNVKTQEISAAFLLLRVLCNNCEDMLNIANVEVKLLGFICRVLPEIAKKLEISDKEQTYISIQKIKDYDNRVLSDLTKVNINKLDDFENNRNDLSAFYARLFRTHKEFLSFIGYKTFIDDILEVIKDFKTNISNGNIGEAKKNSEDINAKIKNAASKDSYYIRFYIQSILYKIVDIFNAIIRNNIKPANLFLDIIDKYYNLNDRDASISLRLDLNNKGDGSAYDVELKITFDDKIDVNSSKNNIYYYSWNKINPGIIPIEIPINVLEIYVNNMPAMYELTWSDLEGGDKNIENIIEFKTSKKIVDWNIFSATTKYSIKPVRNSDEFIGKENRVIPISSDIRTTLHSAWLFGMKRVGKTSTMYAIERELKNCEKFSVITLSYGDFGNPDEKELINSMVETIINRFNLGLALDIKPALNGSLSPLINYLYTANNITNKYLYFMIDEFDEIPYSFYSPNPISQPFWQALRTISQSDYAGFLFVGGENINKLKTSWGSSLNLLRSHKADLFTSKDMMEYYSLITNPVKNELEFSETSLQMIHNVTGGNPFFTKLLCLVIIQDACNIHNPYITDIEVEKAITDTVKYGAEMDHFQHFIDDGLKGEQSATAIKLQLRAKYLYCIANMLNDPAIIFLTMKDLEDKCIANGLNGEEFADLKFEFIERNILLIENDKILFKIPLFMYFLRFRGLIELPKFFRTDDEYQKRLRREKELEVTNKEFENLEKAWSFSYQNKIIKANEISNWISQFEDIETQRKMFEFLKKIKLIRPESIIESLKYAYNLATRNIIYEKTTRQILRDDIFVSYFDGPGKSGNWIANQFKHVNQILKKNIIEYSKIEQYFANGTNVLDLCKSIVFVDDFSCSGNTIIDYLKKNLDMLLFLVKEKKIKILIYVTIGFTEAHDKILRYINANKIGIEIHFGETLDSKEQIFSDSSRYYQNETDRRSMCSIMTEYGNRLDRKTPLGYEGSQVAIIFPENCPNNSLPILWKNKEAKGVLWKALFPRSLSY